MKTMIALALVLGSSAAFAKVFESTEIDCAAGIQQFRRSGPFTMTTDYRKPQNLQGDPALVGSYCSPNQNIDTAWVKAKGDTVASCPIAYKCVDKAN